MSAKKIRFFDKDPRHVAAEEKLRQLWDKREQLVKIKDEILYRPKPPDIIGQEAQKLLQSETLEIPPAPSIDDEELERAYRDIQIVERAITAQKDIIQKLEYEISAQICKEVKSVYTEKVRAIAEAVQRLAECAQEERDFRESLTDQGVHLTFEPMAFFKVGFSREENAYANIYIRQAKRAGYLYEEITVPGFIVRRGGSREYLPKEYRGAPQDYYAHRMREAMRKRPNPIQMSRAAALEKDRLLDSEVSRLRARYRQLVNKTRLLKRNDGIQITENPRIRFAPKV